MDNDFDTAHIVLIFVNLPGPDPKDIAFIDSIFILLSNSNLFISFNM